MNFTARCIWELLSADCSQDELASAISERFSISPEAAREDVLTFLYDACRLGIIQE